jgi:hypothetical protein
MKHSAISTPTRCTLPDAASPAALLLSPCPLATRFVPGWDTHGLPIELKVLQGLPASERAGLDTLGLRAKAKEYALATIDTQKEQFKR